MPTYILKLVDEKNRNKAYYLEYSTIVDAPITFGMSLREFKEYYIRRYCHNPHGLGCAYESVAYFEERLARVRKKGTSAIDYDSAEAVMCGNRAGKGEKRLSVEKIIDYYCRKKKSPNELGGR